MRQAQWVELVFAVGKGKHKTQLQRDIEALREFIDKKEEYYTHLGKFGNRNSYSKTDVDATFMHMKDDYMRNGQLKPGYNIQIGVESEYIVGLGAFSNRSDVGTLIPFLNRLSSHTSMRYERIVADAGYESSENYLYLNENGYMISTRYYSNDKCGRCPHKSKCHKSQNGYRTVRVNQTLNEYRPKVLEALTGDEGVLLRMNRSIQVEGVFGVLKEDFGFRRFLTKGKRNIETQFFLLAFAFNIKKLCNRIKKGRIGLDLFALNAS